MKILITGGDGNIAKYLTKTLSEHNCIFPLPKKTLDVTKKTEFLEKIKYIDPDIVIHTAALSDLDLCENDETSSYAVNALGSLNTASVCSILDIPIIYLSCSSVYEGTKTIPYFESDECNPVSIYGKSKLAGESLIRTMCSKYFIVRTSWVFGGEKCFVKDIIDKANIPIFMCSDEISCPTYIEDLCTSIEQMLHSDLYGIYNIANSDYTKKSLWVKTIFDYMNIKKDIIEIPYNSFESNAPRSKCTILDTSLLNKCFNLELPSWQESLYKYMKK